MYLKERVEAHPLWQNASESKRARVVENVLELLKNKQRL
jgi:hypothetical protein